MTTDDSLIAELRAGRLAAFDELMRRYERLVYKVVQGFACRHDDALDLTQSVFLRAYRALGSFRGEASFKTWLLRIAYHEAINWSQQARLRGVDEELDAEAAVHAVAPMQEAGLVERQRSGIVRRALGRLHARYRVAITLRYLDGLPIREIAAVLGCSETMTKNLLFRGVRKLRREVLAAL